MEKELILIQWFAVNCGSSAKNDQVFSVLVFGRFGNNRHGSSKTISLFKLGWLTQRREVFDTNVLLKQTKPQHIAMLEVVIFRKFCFSKDSLRLGVFARDKKAPVFNFADFIGERCSRTPIIGIRAGPSSGFGVAPLFVQERFTRESPMSSILRIVALLVLLAPFSYARDIYVHGIHGDNRCSGYSDQNTGGLNDGPVRTLSRALELADGGDRIVVAPEGGPYRESISLVGRTHGGKHGFPLIIEGQGAILDGTEALPPGIWRHFHGDVYRFQLTMQPTNWTYFAIYDRGELLERIAVESDAKEIPALKPNTWCLFRGFVFFRTDVNKSPLFETDYELSYSARQVGVSLIQVRDVRIHDLHVQGFQLDGISAANGARDIVLDAIVAQRNGRSGLAVGGASTVSAGYCTFSENQTTQVFSQPFSRLKLFDCEVDKDGITRSDDAELAIE